MDIWTIAEMLKKYIAKAGDNPEAIVLVDALDNRLRRLSEATEPIINDIMREEFANKKVAYCSSVRSTGRARCAPAIFIPPWSRSTST